MYVWMGWLLLFRIDRALPSGCPRSDETCPSVSFGLDASMRRASSWSGCLYTAFSYADLTMWRRNPAKDALERLLKELKTRIKAEKKQVKSEPDGRGADGGNTMYIEETSHREGSRDYK